MSTQPQTQAQTQAQAQTYTGISGKMNRMVSWLETQSIKLKLLYAFLAGAVMTLALPPVFIYPGFLIGFLVATYLVATSRSGKQAFWLGWMFGFGYFLCSLYWISHALVIFSNDFWWMVPFAAIGLPAFFAIYTGLAGWLAHKPAALPLRISLWGFGWVLGEWLRGHLFTGFPWNLIGQSWSMSDALSQMAAYIGIYGISLLAVLSVTALALFPFCRHILQRLCLVLMIALPVFAYALGSYRLHMAEEVDIAKDHGMRLVQSGIPQKEKWGVEFRRRNFELLLSLSQKDRPDWVKTVIWPETAAAFMLEEDLLARDAIGYSLPQDGYLLTGTVRRESDAEKGYKLYNSMMALDDHGQIVEGFDKSHLVPFGEYVPLSDWLPFPIQKVTKGAVDFSPGPGPRSLKIGDLPLVGPLICYEVIFPGQVMNKSQPAQWLLNLTNDAWYGETAGPHQHLDITRIRAIEEGVPMVRAANTGISAIIDPYGRVLQKLDLNKAGVIDFYLPSALQTPTLFSQMANGPFMILLGLWAGMMLLFSAPILSWLKNKAGFEQA